MKVMVPLAQGLEEIEAVTIIDVLRRAGLTVHTASLEPGPVEGSHGITLEADYTLSELKASDYECLALPGGMPGSENLSKSAALADWIRDIHGRGGYLAAVCAAPMVLGGAGVLKGRTVTCYPGFETYCTGAAITGAPVEVDGAIEISHLEMDVADAGSRRYRRLQVGHDACFLSRVGRRSSAISRMY